MTHTDAIEVLRNMIEAADKCELLTDEMEAAIRYAIKLIERERKVLV